MKSRLYAVMLMLTTPGCVALTDLCDVDASRPNRLGNGDFAALTCWADGDEEEDWQRGYLSSESDSPGSGAPVFTVVGSEAEQPFDTQLLQGRNRTPRRKAGLGLQSGDDVRISFWAVTEQAPRSVYVHLTDDNEGWLYEEVPLSTEWTEYSVETTLVGGDASAAFLDLQLAGPGTLHIDDVVLEVMN